MKYLEIGNMQMCPQYLRKDLRTMQKISLINVHRLVTDGIICQRKDNEYHFR